MGEVGTWMASDAVARTGPSWGCRAANKAAAAAAAVVGAEARWYGEEAEEAATSVECIGACIEVSADRKKYMKI